MKHREVVHKSSQNKVAESQFGIVCQLTPPSITLILYPADRPNFDVIVGCLSSILHLSFIQLLFASTIIACHQHIAITCPKLVKCSTSTTFICASHQAGQDPWSFHFYNSVFTGVANPIFIDWSPAQFILKVSTLTAGVENAYTDNASQNSATAFYPA